MDNSIDDEKMGSIGDNYSGSDESMSLRSDARATEIHSKQRPPFNYAQDTIYTNHDMTLSETSTSHIALSNVSGNLAIPYQWPGMHPQRSIPSQQIRRHQRILPQTSDIKNLKQNHPALLHYTLEKTHETFGSNALVPNYIQNWHRRSALPQSPLLENDARVTCGLRSNLNNSVSEQLISDSKSLVKVSEVSPFRATFPHLQNYPISNVVNNSYNTPRIPHCIDRNTHALLHMQQQYYEKLLHNQAQLLYLATRNAATVTPCFSGHLPYHPIDVSTQVNGMSRKIVPKQHKMITLNKLMKISRKKKNKVRDPLRPKRPLSGYNLFFRDQRANLLKCTTSTVRSVAKNQRVGKPLKAVKPDSSNGISMPLDDKPEGSDKTVDFSTKIDTVQKPETAKTMAEDTVLLHQSHQIHGNIGFEALGRIIGHRWSLLNSEDRKRYGDMAQEDMIRYKMEMDAYREMKKSEHSTD